MRHKKLKPLNKTVAKIITYTLQPLLMPFYGVLFLLNYDSYYAYVLDFGQKSSILSFIFLLTFALPAFAAVVLKNMGYINSFEMETRQERKLPTLITAVIYTALFILLRRMNGMERINTFLLASTIAVVMAGLITSYYKISMHMTGCGGFVGMVVIMSATGVFNLIPGLIVSVVLAGLVGVARIELKAHTPVQVYLGFLLGFTVVFVLGMVF